MAFHENLHCFTSSFFFFFLPDFLFYIILSAYRTEFRVWLDILSLFPEKDVFL